MLTISSAGPSPTSESSEQFKANVDKSSDLIKNAQGFAIDVFSDAKAPYENLDPTFKLKWLQENYCLNDMVKKIVSASQNNQKICLFIGRMASEPLPSEENCTWISGDIELADQPFSLEDRIHLQIDFNDETKLEKIHNLFDKIVIDQSTCKCMDGDFISRFTKLLKKSDTCQLIFERIPCTIGFDHESTEWSNHYNTVKIPLSYMMKDKARDKEIFTSYKEQADEQTKDVDQIEFRNQPYVNGERFSTFETYIVAKIRNEKNEPSLKQQALINAQLDNKRHTATLFQNVEVHENSTFPYPTNYSRPGKDTFFVATGLKL
jgi:hypothetical protein